MGEKYIKNGKVIERGGFFGQDKEVGKIKSSMFGSYIEDRNGNNIGSVESSFWGDEHKITENRGWLDTTEKGYTLKKDPSKLHNWDYEEFDSSKTKPTNYSKGKSYKSSDDNDYNDYDDNDEYHPSDSGYDAVRKLIKLSKKRADEKKSFADNNMFANKVNNYKYSPEKNKKSSFLGKLVLGVAALTVVSILNDTSKKK